MNCSPYLLKPLRELGDVMGNKHSHFFGISIEVESGHDEGDETPSRVAHEMRDLTSRT